MCLEHWRSKMKIIGNFDGSLADITSVVAGTGLSGGGTTGAVTLNVDASIPEITTLAGLTTIGATGVNTLISSDDVQMYNPVNNGNPQLAIGSSATNQVVIRSNYVSGTQNLEYEIKILHPNILINHILNVLYQNPQLQLLSQRYFSWLIQF